MSFFNPFVSETIDLSEYAKKEDLVGKKTANGGEIFNDYENNIASLNAHAEGSQTKASGQHSHVEGYDTIASGNYSHAESDGTTASGKGSHAEGFSTKARGNYSHAEGSGTTASGSSSHAEGYYTTASSQYSHAEGCQTKASGLRSHAEGYYTTASGNYSHAESDGTTASGSSSHAEGYGTTASGDYSHAEGSGTTASGSSSHAEGNSTIASSENQHVQGKYNIEDTNGKYAFIIGNGTNNSTRSNAFAIDWNGLIYTNNNENGYDLSTFITTDNNVGQKTVNGGEIFNDYENNIATTNSHAEGNNTKAYGKYSHAEGDRTTAGIKTENDDGTITYGGDYSHAEGGGTTASGNYSHAEGSGTTASGGYSHTEGGGTQASGYGAHAEGSGTKASGGSSHSEGAGTTASGSSSHAEGGGTTASGDGSHTEGFGTTASGLCSHSEGQDTKAYGKYSHAEGQSTTAGTKTENDDGTITYGGDYSHAEGRNTTASGNYSHAEGNSTTALGHSSHSEGGSTTASGSCSHAEGASTIASGNYSHAEGVSTTALGNYSHAEGLNATASGNYSHAEGRDTKASSDYQHVQGKYNVEDKESKFAFIIGNGTGDSERSNAIAIDWNGLIYPNNSNTGIDLTSLKGDSGEQGPQGEKGDTGVGIESVTFKNSSSGAGAAQPGAIDTYTITYTDGSHTEFQIKNGENGTPAVIDTEMSDTSENTVQNKVIKTYIDSTTGDINSILSTEIDSVKEDLNNLQSRTAELENKVELLVKKETKIYGFRINPNEADPYEAVVYLADAVGMTPAKMGAETFDYGSWKDAFFMPRPCMVKFDGTVDYYLNPDNYKEKEDGSPSDVANADYEGNAMMEFPKIWYKFAPGSEDGEGYFYCSNVKPDDTYHCWCNINSNDEKIDHFYMAIYNGTGTDRLRSLSGVQLTPANGNGNTTGQQEIDRALRNNTTDGVEWYTEVWSDRLLLTALHVLISKSLDTQGSFGQGISSGSQTTKEAYVTGTLDDKGLFFGDTVETVTAVKTFGIENFWSLAWHRVAGCISVDNVLKTKLTYGRADGSGTIGYNSTGNGYIAETSIPTANGYISKMKFSERGFMTKAVAGSTNKFYCDYFYQSSGTRHLLVGGSSDSGAAAGAFYLALSYAFSSASWAIAASLSLKPLLEKGV